jgi:uncharacterized membrane protein
MFSGSTFADLRVCNKTESRVGTALGYLENGNWVSEGWWNIGPHSCEVLLTGPLNNQTYFVYAEDYTLGGAWVGTQQICTDNEEFVIRGFEDCEKRGFDSELAFAVKTGGKPNWTAYLSPGGEQIDDDRPSNARLVPQDRIRLSNRVTALIIEH